MVLMGDGTSKPIAQVQPREIVRTGARTNNVATVSTVHSLDALEIEAIELTGTAGKVLATPEHLFWVDGKGWTTVARLQAGDWLFDSANQRRQIAFIRKLAVPTKVYTLALTGGDSFYANNLLVHELCGVPLAGRQIRIIRQEVVK